MGHRKDQLGKEASYQAVRSLFFVALLLNTDATLLLETGSWNTRMNTIPPRERGSMCTFWVCLSSTSSCVPRTPSHFLNSISLDYLDSGEPLSNHMVIPNKIADVSQLSPRRLVRGEVHPCKFLSLHPPLRVALINQVSTA